MPSKTFNFTQTTESWTVPAGVTRVDIAALGASGGDVTAGIDSAEGGAGGQSEGTLLVRPGQQLQVTVGGAGGNTVGMVGGPGGAGGWNTGGNGGASLPGTGTSGAGGGGKTEVELGATRVLIAGGGGGAAGLVLGGGFLGGGGGGVAGGNGSFQTPASESKGGTATAAGSGGGNGASGNACQVSQVYGASGQLRQDVPLLRHAKANQALKGEWWANRRPRRHSCALFLSE